MKFDLIFTFFGKYPWQPWLYLLQCCYYGMFHLLESKMDPYDYDELYADDGRYDDDPNPYHGDYSEE